MNTRTHRFPMSATAILVAGFIASPLAFAQDHQSHPAKDHAAKDHAATADSEQPVSDTWITTKLKADLLTTSDIPATDIKVETVNGVVSLSGTVQSQAQADKAVDVAKMIKGVRDVKSTDLRVVAGSK